MKALQISFVVAALLLPLSASAAGKKQSTKQTCPDKPTAKRAFNAGHLAYRRGQYEEAILKFQNSYAACEKPLTLLAIGNAYERLGDLEAALEHLEGYRKDAHKREHAELDERIATLEGRIAEDKAEAERKAKQEAARKAEEERKQQEQAQEDDTDGVLTLAGWITGAAGVAALVGSVVTGAWALSLDGDLADGCVDGNCAADRESDIDKLETLSATTDALLVVGVTMTAGGVLMLLLSQPSDPSTSVGLSLSPGLGGASLRGSF